MRALESIAACTSVLAQPVDVDRKTDLTAETSEVSLGATRCQQPEALPDGCGHSFTGRGLSAFEQRGRDVDRDFLAGSHAGSLYQCEDQYRCWHTSRRGQRRISVGA